MRLFIPALAMGLAWALRGHFGHEHGAAWAGAVATLAVLIIARRPDWNRRIPVLASLGALSWSIGGIMSYGIVVGYGRGTDFPNVFYGLAMLFVIGGLYGFFGGGLLGLGLETTAERRPAWASLVCEMVAGGILCWGTLIYQFEWLMTPPRSELWAACLGAAIALAWFLVRNGFRRSLVLAIFSALGAGLGFSLGNFFQTAGSASGYVLNWWNVMEFTLGFFGGLGMAYAVTRTGWEESDFESEGSNFLGVGFLLLGIPFVNLIQAFESERLISQAERLALPDAVEVAATQRWLAWGVLGLFLLVGLFILLRFRERRRGLTSIGVRLFGLVCLLEFTLFSYIRKAVFATGFSSQPEQLVYWILVLLLIGMVAFSMRRDSTVRLEPERLAPMRWRTMIAVVLISLAVLALISIHLHDGLPGVQTRF